MRKDSPMKTRKATLVKDIHFVNAGGSHENYLAGYEFLLDEQEGIGLFGDSHVFVLPDEYTFYIN